MPTSRRRGRADGDGNLIDASVRTSITELLEALRAWTARLSAPEAVA
jgi:hypothetical protein